MLRWRLLCGSDWLACQVTVLAIPSAEGAIPRQPCLLSRLVVPPAPTFRPLPAPGEGSHATFAPRGWKQKALARFVTTRYGHCEIEQASEWGRVRCRVERRASEGGDPGGGGGSWRERKGGRSGAKSGLGVEGRPCAHLTTPEPGARSVLTGWPCRSGTCWMHAGAPI